MQGNIKEFINKQSTKSKIIVIYGPTGCGKTTLSIEVAKQIDAEIISTDSRQIFQYLNIGTGKITKEEMQGVPHHMIDIIPPDEEYSVGAFKKAAESIINTLHGEGKIPILCGGTGLYIDSLIYDFNIPGVVGDENLRKTLENEAEEFGKEHVYNKLVQLDPEYAKELHPNNLRYVIRALEIKILTGKSKSEFREEKKLKYNTLFLTPYDGNREKLYEKIDTRVEQMFTGGFVMEVQKLIEKGYKKTDFGMQSIGYREVIAHLEGERTLEETILLVQQHNRNYAKKQLIWFRSYEDLISLSKKKGTLFTKERILFLMVVFIVFSIPLFYRYIFGLL